MMNRWIVTMWVVLLGAMGWAEAPTSAADKPAAAAKPIVYRDPMGQFELTLPVGAKWVPTANTSTLQWVSVPEKEKEPEWTLTIRATTVKLKKKYDTAIARQKAIGEGIVGNLKLRLKENVTITNQQWGAQTGCPCFVVEGIATLSTDAIKTETQIFRQMWIAMEGDEYLSVILVGKGDRASQVLSAWKQVRKGFVMHDVTALRKARQKASDQAHAFLVKTASAELLSKSICVEPQWFLIHDGEQRLGWLRIQGRQTTRQKEEGFELGIWMMTQQPADAKGNAQPPRLVYRNMFTNADRSFEMWTTRIQIGSGESAGIVTEQGLRRDTLSLCNTSTNRTVHKGLQKRMTPGAEYVYLPKLIGLLLPMLLDRSEPAMYVFSEYDAGSNDFRMRQFTVKKPVRSRIDGAMLTLTPIVDQLANQSGSTTTTWVDPKGQIQRIVAGASRTRRASQRKVLARYPQAIAICRSMSQAVRDSGWKYSKDMDKIRTQPRRRSTDR